MSRWNTLFMGRIERLGEALYSSFKSFFKSVNLQFRKGGNIGGFVSFPQSLATALS